jgi:ribose transport system permease protein
MKTRTPGIVLAALGFVLFAVLVTLCGLDMASPATPGRFLMEVPLGQGRVLVLPAPFVLSALVVNIGVLLAARGRLADFRELIVLVIVFSVFALMSDVSTVFLRWQNLSAILLAVSIQGIVAIGMTILLVSGGFDLSVGSVVGLTGAVTALAMVQGLPMPAAVSASYPFIILTWVTVDPLTAIWLGLAVGAFIGLVNGLVIAKVGINAFITTLAMMGIARGALMVVTGGRNISGLPESFNWIGQDRLLCFQYPILISLVLVALGDILLRRSRFFRQNYYIGGNEKAAVLSGINVDGMKVFNYVLTGLLAAAAGIILTARFGSASVTMGAGLELQVISGVIIGGASLQGGEGTVLGSFLGCMLMALIVSALNLLGVDIYWQGLIIGATLLAAVMIDTLGKKRKGIV